MAVEPKGLAQYLVLAATGIMLAFWGHPFCVPFIARILQLDDKIDMDSANFIFTTIAIVYAILVGCTFQICYERQVSLVNEVYDEIITLEALIQAALVFVADSSIRKQLTIAIRRYIKTEIQNPNNAVMDSPYAFNSVYNEIGATLVKAHDQGYDVCKLVEAAHRLTGSFSVRSSVMALVLPGMHWVFMISMQIIFVICFLVFDASGGIDADSITLERRFNFASLVGTLVLIQLTLLDLNNPAGGLYSFNDKVNERLSYVETMCSEMEARESGWAPPQLLAMARIDMLAKAKE